MWHRKFLAVAYVHCTKFPRVALKVRVLKILTVLNLSEKYFGTLTICTGLFSPQGPVRYTKEVVRKRSWGEKFSRCFRDHRGV